MNQEPDHVRQEIVGRYAADRPREIHPDDLTRLAIIYPRQSSPQQVRENIGSTAVQRALAEIPRRWGWPPELIKIIDDDLGLSGKSAHGRSGFHQMLELIDAGKVGAIFVYDVSRISRNPLDAEIFLHKVIRRRVPIVAQGRVYSTSSKDIAALLGLRVQNLWSWLDNETRAQRFTEAKHAMIRRKLAVSRPPIGYREYARGKWAMDSTPLVQESIHRIFELYRELGSVNKVAKYHQQHGLPFPRRVLGEIQWCPIAPMQVSHVLKNPNYTDAYVYNRQRVIEADDTHKRQVIRLPELEWTIERDHHEAYVTWDGWHEIQRLLAERRVKRQPAIATGEALLQGLLWCGRCDRWIRVTYDMKDGRRRRPSYVCRPGDRLGTFKRCFATAAYSLDRAVEERFLTGMTPATIESVLDAVNRAKKDREHIDWARRRVVQDATDAVRLADRRHREADPTNPWAKTYLEQQLNDAVRCLAEIEGQHTASDPMAGLSLAPDEVAELLRLAQDLRALWSAPTTTSEDRKELLRAAVNKVVIQRKTDEAVEFEIVWFDGRRQEGRTFRSKSIEDHVADAYHAGHSGAAAIANVLRSQGVTNVFGRPITKDVVSNALSRLGIRRHDEWVQALALIRQSVLDGRARPEMLADLRTRGLRHWLGEWTSARIDSAIHRLRLGTIPDGVRPLPPDCDVAHAIKTPPRMVEMIRAGREQKRPWRVIVDEISASGLRRANGGILTPAAARTLYHNWTRKT